MITILDGGMGQELVARCPDAPTSLWSTKIMMDHPHLIREVHDDYFAAGATVATANTYAIHRDRLGPYGLEDRFEALHTAALHMARQAANHQSPAARVAVSFGPLGWSYRPDLTPEHRKAVANFAEIAAIHGGKTDIFLGETMASVAEVKALVEATQDYDVPLWLSLCVDDADGTRLRSGEPLAAAFDSLGHAQAILLNCSLPEAISDGLPLLAKVGLPFGAYANGFTNITAAFAQAGSDVGKLKARTDLGPQAYADFARKWADQGATIIGGCCEVGPAHIAAVCEALVRAGYALAPLETL